MDRLCKADGVSEEMEEKCKLYETKLAAINARIRDWESKHHSLVT